MTRLQPYLKNPVYCANEKPGVNYFILLILGYIVSTLPVIAIAIIICKNFHIVHNQFVFNSFETVVFGVILAPVYEEIIFRSWLKFTKPNIILFILVVSILIVYTALISKTGILIVLCILLVSILSVLKFASTTRIEFFISSNFKYFFYASALTFGLGHASNYTGNIYAILAFSFILGGPQIIAGLFLGFIRMNYGLFYSILFHIIINSTLLLRFIY